VAIHPVAVDLPPAVGVLHPAHRPVAAAMVLPEAARRRVRLVVGGVLLAVLRLVVLLLAMALLAGQVPVTVLLAVQVPARPVVPLVTVRLVLLPAAVCRPDMSLRVFRPAVLRLVTVLPAVLRPVAGTVLLGVRLVTVLRAPSLHLAAGTAVRPVTVHPAVLRPVAGTVLPAARLPAGVDLRPAASCLRPVAALPAPGHRPKPSALVGTR
jgi:hypothetical protein